MYVVISHTCFIRKRVIGSTIPANPIVWLTHRSVEWSSYAPHSCVACRYAVCG